MTSRDTDLETNPAQALETDKQLSKSARLSDAVILTRRAGYPQHEPRLSHLFEDVPLTTDEMLLKVAQLRAEAHEAFLKSVAGSVRNTFSGIYEIFRRLLSTRSPIPRLKI
jgi:hypothetical protein